MTTTKKERILERNKLRVQTLEEVLKFVKIADMSGIDLTKLRGLEQLVHVGVVNNIIRVNIEQQRLFEFKSNILKNALERLRFGYQYLLKSCERFPSRLRLLKNRSKLNFYKNTIARYELLLQTLSVNDWRMEHLTANGFLKWNGVMDDGKD